MVTVDDGTGVLRCTHWREKDDSDKGLMIPELGQLVSIWGKLSEFRDVKELTVTDIVVQEDPNAEPLYWLEVARLKRTVYSKPFSLPEEFLKAGLCDPASLKATVQESVLEFLNENYLGKHFTLLELPADTALVNACKEGARGCGSKEQEVIEEVSRLIQNLPEIGVVIPALGVGRHRETKYEVGN